MAGNLILISIIILTTDRVYCQKRWVIRFFSEPPSLKRDLSTSWCHHKCSYMYVYYPCTMQTFNSSLIQHHFVALSYFVWWNSSRKYGPGRCLGAPWNIEVSCIHVKLPHKSACYFRNQTAGLYWIITHKHDRLCGKMEWFWFNVCTCRFKVT